MKCSWLICNQEATINGMCFHHHRVWGTNPVKEKVSSDISKRSKKRADQEKLYVKIKKAMMSESKECEANLDDCSKIAIDLHHLAGRIGKRLTDPNNLIRVCRNCHNYLTDNPLVAVELGLSKKRNTND